MTPQQTKRFKDKLFRLNHLYWIRDKRNKKVKFKMTAEQLYYFENIHFKNIILKARQMGFTTEVCIIQLDAAMFSSHTCALIAHTKPDAQRLFRDKVKYAYDNLPLILRQANPLTVNNTDEYVFRKGGKITVSTSFRGGTLQWLHVSEFGKICAKHPEKAREIVTGAFEAVSEGGYITLESTAEGRQGYFFEYSQEAEKNDLSGKELLSGDWKFFFFAWWKNESYVMKFQTIPNRLKKYFKELKDRYGIETSPEQQSWYYSKEKTLGGDMKREYPSRPAEAFAQSIKGAYYSKQFSDLYANGRIIEKLPDNSHQPVSTYWDLGVSDSTTIWFIRKVGNEYHVIDFYSNSGEGLNHYFKVLKDKGYNYEKHVAPHDVENRNLGTEDAKSLKQMASEGYLIDGHIYSVDFETVPRTLNVNADIETVRQILPKCVFDSVQCEEGLKAIEAYKKEWNDKLGVYRDKPLHDWASDASDAFRYFAVNETKPEPIVDTTIEMSM